MNDDIRLGLVVGGAALLVIALVWRLTTRSRTRRALLRGLDASEPQERARAGIQLIELGLPRAARPLLDLVPRENDARVRLAIALAVARRQWEPSNAARVTTLRDWASTELERQGQPVRAFGPAFTRISDMGGPRPAGSGPAPPPTPEQEPEQEHDQEPDPTQPLPDITWRSGA